MTESILHFDNAHSFPDERERRQTEILSEFIHYLRINRQISIFDCAAVLGTDYQIIDNIECGKASSIHTAFLLNFITFIQTYSSKNIPASDAEELWSEIGKLSFNLRKKLGYSLDEIAAFTNLKVSDIDDIECCHKNNNKSKIMKIIEFYVRILGRIY